jgi:hypothetical protein
VEIAARCDTSPQVVHRRRKRFVEQRLNGLDDRPGTGRPRVFPPSVNAEIKAMAWELPATISVLRSRWSCTELAKELIVSGVVAFI